MSEFIIDIGTQTKEYGELAELCFKMLLQRWFGHPISLSAHHPDVQQVDVSVVLPSLSGQGLNFMPEIVLDWQIKHTSQAPNITDIELGGREIRAFRTHLKKGEVEKLRRRARSKRERYMLAYGFTVVHPEGTTIADSDPYNMFDWYGLDLVQYFDMVGDDASTIFMPIGNKLNLASFSLLWASHWVKDFYRPLKDPQVYTHPDIARFIELLYYHHKRTKLHVDVLAIKRTLEHEFPRYLKELQVPEASKQQISIIIGTAVAIEDICNSLRTLGEIEELMTYCPEALFGTASLWLFSTTYWMFMTQSASVTRGENAPKNQRWLPVRSNVADTPRVLAAVLQHAVELYRRLGVDAMLVHRRSDEGIGTDRSYYGGGIGHFPYFSLSEDGLHWSQQHRSKDEVDEHRAFFADTDYEVLLGHRVPILQSSLIKAVPAEQMTMRPPAPCMLFAEESEFLRHPLKLWEPAYHPLPIVS